jgi:hypothetical protein
VLVKEIFRLKGGSTHSLQIATKGWSA